MPGSIPTQDELIGELRARTNRLFEDISQLTSQQVDPQQEIRKATKSAINRQVYQALNQQPIDSLAGEGVRVDALKRARVTTVAKAASMSERRLQQIPGVGKITASRIRIRAVAARDAEREKTALKIDDRGRPRPHTNLVKAVYLSKRLPILYEAQNALFSEIEEFKSQVETLFAQISTSGPSANLTNLSNLRILSQKLPEYEARLSAAKQLTEQILNAPEETIWESFLKDPASTYAAIEAATGSKAPLHSDNLTGGLAEKVATYQLDLSMMKSSLREYQEFGVKYVLAQKRTLLGDEMGLGKTVQAIGVMADLSARSKCRILVVCPLSVLENWLREIPKHSRLKSLELYGNKREDALARWRRKGGVAVTSYETARWLAEQNYPALDLLVVDEAHYTKNPAASRTRAVLALCSVSRRVMYMTGTPLENRPEELTSLVSSLRPEMRPKLERALELEDRAAFRKLIAPIYLRRRRDDVLGELPNKVEETRWLTFTQTDLEDYRESVQNRRFHDMRRVSWHHGKMEKSAKARELVKICQQAYAEGRKVLVFSEYLDTLDHAAVALGKLCFGMLKGDVSAKRRQGLIDEFTQGEGCALLCQVQAGGVGLNIRAASVVVFCEPQLKPSTEDQAVSRAYRMGQTETVSVYRLLISKSVDERIDQILRAKRELVAQYADESEAALELQDLFGKGVRAKIMDQERKRHLGKKAKRVHVQDENEHEDSAHGKGDGHEVDGASAPESTELHGESDAQGSSRSQGSQGSSRSQGEHDKSHASRSEKKRKKSKGKRTKSAADDERRSSEETAESKPPQANESGKDKEGSNKAAPKKAKASTGKNKKGQKQKASKRAKSTIKHVKATKSTVGFKASKRYAKSISRRAHDLGLSRAEYLRRLVKKDMKGKR